MRIKFFTLLLFVVCKLNAQQISGYVSDAETGEVLIGAHVYASSSKAFSVSNTYGFFSLLLQRNDSIVVSYVGYSKKVLAPAYKNKPMQIKLQVSTHIDEVIVSARKSIQKKSEMGVLNIPLQQLKSIPSLAGEQDIMKAFQLMPGIKSVGEGQSSFMVRGGSPDQNMVILDNVPLYHINHLGGFVSVFNTESLNDVTMYKGAFPARYGGRLSSIIDVNTKDGNLKEHHSTLTVGMITSKLLLEGPIKKDTLSYLFSVRRFMYDLITRPLTYFANSKKQMGYTFYDLNAKINYKPNQNNRLHLSLYSGRDKLLRKQKNTSDGNSLMRNTTVWGNYSSSIRWNHIYSSKLFSNMSLYYMNYKYNSAFKYSYKENSNEYSTNSDFSSGISDLGFITNYEYYLFAKLSIRFGSNHIYHTYKPNNYQYSQDVSNSDQKVATDNHSRFVAFENSLFLETEGTLFSYLSFNFGYRTNSFSTTKKTYINHEPRVVINTNLPKIGSIKASYARMSQYVHLLTYFGTSMPADLWVPSTDIVPPQTSDIYSIGFYKEIANGGFDLSVEAYYKNLYHLIEYMPGYNIFSSTEDWVSSIEQDGKGKSKGIEVLLQRKTGRLTGWISYTLSKSTRQFENINNGQSYLYTYDATHDFSIVSTYKLKENITLSATWTYMTGRAISMPNEYYQAPILNIENDPSGTENIINTYPQVNYDIVSSYDQKNDVRMSPYHRLDVSVNYKKHKKKSDRLLSIGVYNLYSRQNAVYYYIGTKEIVDNMGRATGKLKRVVYQRSLFPVIPSVSYTWTW
jgi:hypothetical protein